MSIRYICASCGQKYKSDDEYAGRKVKCPQCGVLLEIPKAENIPSRTIELIERPATEQSSAEVQRLLQDNQSLRMENAEITVERDKYKTGLDCASSEIAILKKDIEGLQSASVKDASLKKELETLQSSSSQEIALLKKELEMLQGTSCELQESRKQVLSLKDELAELKNVDKMNEQMREELKTMTEIKDENMQLNEQLTKSRIVVSELNDKCAKFTDEVDRMQQSVNALGKEKKNLSMLLAEKDEMLEQLKEENKKAASEAQTIMDAFKEVLPQVPQNSEKLELVPGSDTVPIPEQAVVSIKMPETNMTTIPQPQQKTNEPSAGLNESKTSDDGNFKVTKKKGLKELLLVYTLSSVIVLVPIIIAALLIIGYRNDKIHKVKGDAGKTASTDTVAATGQKDTTGIEKCRKDAEHGDAEAQNRLGSSYQIGICVVKDYVEAVKWFRKAAEQGNAEGQARLSNCYYFGQGVKQDKAEAVKWTRKAAEQGQHYSQYFLARHYSSGDGVRQDWSEAVKWFLKAVENKETLDATIPLAYCYYYGKGVKKDNAEALKWIRKGVERDDYLSKLCLERYNSGYDLLEPIKKMKEAARMGIPEDQQVLKSYGLDNIEETASRQEEAAQKAPEQSGAEALYERGKRYYTGTGVTKDDAEAVKCFRKAAELGDAKAQCDLGQCYLKGDGVTKDNSEAVKWYRKAAEQGLALAQGKLGGCYLAGIGTAYDEVEAVKWISKAAAQRDAMGQFCLALCYSSGIGISKDMTKAVEWYRKAAEQGLAVAQFKLAGCYAKGEGVAEDLAEAVTWCRKAAEQGNANAQFNLGIFYATGTGVAKNPAEALEWFRKSAMQGFAKIPYGVQCKW